MSERAWGFIYIAATIVLTLYGQLMLKWQVNLVNQQPTGLNQSVGFLFRMLTNPWVLSGLAGAIAASMTWMLAVSRLNLSTAYPFMSLSFVLVLVFSSWLFKEPIRPGNVIGVSLIVLGVIIHSRA